MSGVFLVGCLVEFQPFALQALAARPFRRRELDPSTDIEALYGDSTETVFGDSVRKQRS